MKRHDIMDIEIELTVIVISYNTAALTLKCLETLYENTQRAQFKTVVFDNASKDGSADLIAEQFPQVELIRSDVNLGFAKANNVVAENVKTEWILLLNPDTEVHLNAIDNLLSFAKANPQAGITGGRTVFPDGSLNRSSCWQKMTIWSLFCSAIGLTAAFPHSGIFNTEGMGEWKRDSVRQVDIVVGCFLMIGRELWNELNGFDLRYFMYGEEADLCLRAAQLGYRPLITPDAEIMHLIGASSDKKVEKFILVSKAKVTLIKNHWPRSHVPIGISLIWLRAAVRMFVLNLIVTLSAGKKKDKSIYWNKIWSERRDWLAGY